MTTENWQSVLGDLLDAVAVGDDTFDLPLLSAKSADGTPLKDLLPQAALNTAGDDDLDGWWTDVQAAQSAVWSRHGWFVIRAEPETMSVEFSRVSGNE